MGMREVEAAILRELRDVAGNQKIRQKDIMEWSSGNVNISEGETHYYLPTLRINVAVKLPAPKTAAKSQEQS